MKMLAILILGIPVCVMVGFVIDMADTARITKEDWALSLWFYLFWLAGTLYYFS